MKNKLTFITGNEAKAKYLSNYFGIPVNHHKLDLPEIQSLDLEEVVIDKAKRAYEVLKTPVLVEDVSLVFHGLKRLPGPLIKWFLHSLGNEGLSSLVDKLDSRIATATVQFCYCDGKECKVFEGSMEGTISEKPKGEMGFGWDPIFIPKGHTRTWAEMTEDEKHETSIRKIALEKLEKFLLSPHPTPLPKGEGDRRSGEGCNQ